MAEPGSAEARRPSNWNVPNAITVARIVMAPIFIWMLLADNGEDSALRWWAAGLFVFAIATDGIDGYIARSRGIVTELGKLLDPIADKVLTGGALVALSVLGELPWWVTIVVLVREIGITVHRFIVISDHVVAAAWMGKLKTVVQAIAIAIALTPFWVFFGEWVFWVNGALMTLAVLLTVASGIDYVITAVRGSRSGQERQAG